MDERRERHLGERLGLLCRLAEKKYRRGSAEHNEYLPDKSLHDLILEALHENIDQSFYLLEALMKVGGEESADERVGNEKLRSLVGPRREDQGGQ